MKAKDDFTAIYHELSGRYGQMMTSQEVCAELGVKRGTAARKLIPEGWIGTTRDVKIKTVSFARQLAELNG